MAYGSRVVALTGVAVGAAVLTSACVGGTQAGSTADGATTPAPTAATTAASMSQVELDAALLTAADLPAGFTAKQPEQSATSSVRPSATLSQPVDGGPGCDGFLAAAAPGETGDIEGSLTASAGFVHKSTRATVTEVLRSGPDETTIRAIFTKMRTVFGQCREMTVTSSGLDFVFRLETMSGADVGDERFALRWIGTAEPLPAPIVVDLHLVRHGDLLVQILVLNPPDLRSLGGPGAKPLDTRALMETAYAKAVH